MPTFLHTADIHLDSPFSAHFDARGAELRRGELRRSVSDMIDKAKDLDLLLIAGDLFDGSCVSAETIAFLKRKFAQIPDTKIFIVAGNHDAYTPTSVYKTEDFGENVHIFDTTAECVELPEIKTRVFGVSFKDGVCDKSIPLPEIEKIDGVTDILLLHADLVSVGGESRYNPIDKRVLENCGADYVALGHIHKRSEMKRCGETYYAYSGTPEGRGFDECGDLGCYIGSIENKVVKVSFERVCRRRMFHVSVDVSTADDSLYAAELAMKEIERVGTREDFYKLILKGRVRSINPLVVTQELREKLHYIEVYDETKACYDIEKMALQNTLCGEFIRIMKKKSENATADDASIIEEAMLLGIEALLGGDE